ncbi:dihydrodipicolinate synthase family protein [Actinomadura sp. 1N219]|uniref:dihydrodipicolinate synthase family protein n=1 Tax=Actinomadura sp. 1N219 TaxID=3375152 RepID=UPI0037A93D2E
MTHRPEVITAVPTPFTAAGPVDLAAARAIYGFAAAATGLLFVCGTTGEFPALDDAERLSLVEAALEAAGPDGVIAHVGAPDAHRAIGLGRAAVRLGARRLAAITPYFLPAEPAETVDHFRRLAAAVQEVEPDVRVYAYVYPERTGTPVDPGLLAELAAIPGLAGAKLSGSAAGLLRACRPYVPDDFDLYSGDDSDLARVVRDGGAGIVSGCSAALPEPFVRLAAALGRDSGVDPADGAATRDAALLIGPSIGRLKYAQALRGLPSGASRMAVQEPGPVVAAAIDRLVRRAGAGKDGAGRDDEDAA